MDLLFNDLIQILKACLTKFASDSLPWFIAAAVAGLALAVGAWWACSYFAKLWNTKFSLRGWHHVLCALSSLLVFAAVLIGSSLKFTETVAGAIIEFWAEQLKFDEAWGQDTFTKVYDAVKASGKEDFTGYPDPRDGGNRIPTNQTSSQQTVASVNVTSAIENFQQQHPVLSMMLLADKQVPESVVLSDVRSFFGANPGGTYPAANAIRLAVNHVRSGLAVQTPRVVLFSRLILGGCFLLLFSMTLTAISVAAYTDIKVHYVNA